MKRRVDLNRVDDVVSEVMLIAWRKFDDLPSKDPVLWLYAVARRVIANDRRSTRRWAALVQRVASRRAILGHDVVSGDDRLRRALAELGSAEREVLMMAAWENLPHQEIASVLGISEAASRQRLSRAKRRLEAFYGRADIAGEER
jgi:RNA polymerase sigma factor (sigma-70 family)